MATQVVFLVRERKVHGKSLFKINAPYEVIGETHNQYRIMHRTGIAVYVEKDDAKVVTILNTKKS